MQFDVSTQGEVPRVCHEYKKFRVEKMKIAFVYNLKRNETLKEAEFDTLEVVDAITSGLASNGATVTKVEMTKDGSWIDKLISTRPDLVFNTAEGFVGIGREALAPTVFEQNSLPYVGSGPYTCFLTLDKFLTKKVVERNGVLTPDSFFISNMNDIMVISKGLPYPVFVKPNFEGSSKGISQRSCCLNEDDFISYAKESLKDFPEGLLIEKYIEGRDITVAYVEGLGKNLGVLEPIEYTGTTRGNFTIYDYDMKNLDDSQIGVICPANIETGVRQVILEQMKKVVAALGIVDMCRADFRIGPEGEVYFIEVNALPSLHPDAGLFKASEKEGFDYNTTIQKILENALKKNKIKGSSVSRARKIKTRIPNMALVFNMKKKRPGQEGYEDEAEFDNPATIEAIANALRENGFKPRLIEADRDLAKNLLDQNIEVVFNIAEGLNKQSREAQVPALCDLLGIEHTGSDAACLSITLNKALSTKLVLAENLKAPRSVIFQRKKKKYLHGLNYPVIIKPNLEGTSKGIYDNSVVTNEKELNQRMDELFLKFTGPLMVEEFVKGREFTVGLLGENSCQVIGITEIVFKKSEEKNPIYSFEAKSIDEDPLDNSIFRLASPPDINKNLEKKIISVSKKIFHITGCRDVARIDYRITRDEQIYFIEINPLPGLSPGFSDLTILADKNGLPYNNLIGKIAAPAVRRWRKSNS
ncbi:MAG: ATP-grasp domain-containing protein [Bacteriovoracaceae bacterium]|nr:ATP-grasp domain-containing protein [Bacteriovoracaceae bacterium]